MCKSVLFEIDVLFFRLGVDPEEEMKTSHASVSLVGFMLIKRVKFFDSQS